MAVLVRHRLFGSAGQFGLLTGAVEYRSFRLADISWMPISGKSFPIDPIDLALSVARFHSLV
jgi:hypothetical protein